MKQEPEWRKSFLLHAYVHNSKLKNAAIRMVLGHIFTRVFLFLPIFTHVHLCLPLFTCVYLCLPMFTRVQKCLIFLPMFNNDYSCLPMFTNVYLGLITTCLFVFSYVYHSLPYVYLCLLVFTYVYHCLIVLVYLC